MSKIKTITLNRIFSVILVVLLLGVSTSISLADELDDTRNQIEQKEQEANQTEEQLVQAKHYEGTLASQISQMSNDLYLARVNYNNAVAKVAEKEQELATTEAEIGEKESEIGHQTELIEARIRNLYKNSQYSPLEYLFLSENFNEVNSQFVYRVNIIRQDKEIIVELRDKVLVLSDQKSKLETEKEQLAADKASLETQKVQLEAQEAYLNSQIAGAREQQNQLVSQLAGINNEIASLSAKEQSILAAKSMATGNLSSSVGSNPISAAKEPAAPTDQNYWGFFIYGYIHRVGLNQYGAYGRAMAGQSAEQIVGAYYTNTVLQKNYDTPERIPVAGYGNLLLDEEYLSGLGEMSSSWSFEALKAQAIVARTYALHAIYYDWVGSSIVSKSPIPIGSTTSDQVYLGHVKDERWQQAVMDTKGWVLTYDNKPIKAWYSSTAGGATLSSQEVWGGVRPWVSSGIVDIDEQGRPYDGYYYHTDPPSPCYHSLNYCYEAFSVVYKNMEKINIPLAQPWFTSEEMDLIINISQLDPAYRSEIVNSFSHDYPYYVKGYYIYTYEPTMPLRIYGDYRERMDVLKNAVSGLLKQEGKPVFSGFYGADTEVGAMHTGNITFHGDFNLTLDGQHVRTTFNIVAPANDEIKTTKFDIIQSN